MEDPLPGSGPGTWLPLWSLALAIGFTGLASMFFSYIYFLLLNSSRVRLLQLANTNGNGGKEKAEGYLANFTSIMHAVVVVEITFKILFILSLYLFITQAFGMNRVSGLIPAFLVSGLWFVLFCRIIPAEIGSLEEERMLLRLFPLLNRLALVLFPLLYPFLLFSRMAGKIIRPRTPAREAEHIAEEILDAVEEGEREGIFQEHEADMIESIVELHDEEVSVIMTPRMDMFCVDIQTPIQELIKQAMESGHSRVPVFEENRDRIVGILYLKDLLEYWQVDGKETPPLRKLVRKPFFIPETKKISQLLAEFRENKVHIAIVLDEYGGTAGLVTNEDIIEEIVGEIVDEYDREEEQELKILGEGRAEASAKIRIEEINEEMEIDLPKSDDFDTLGGLIFTKLGKVPVKGEVVTWENVEITVMDADDRRINRVAIQVKDKVEN